MVEFRKGEKNKIEQVYFFYSSNSFFVREILNDKCSELIKSHYVLKGYFSTGHLSDLADFLKFQDNLESTFSIYGNDGMIKKIINNVFIERTDHNLSDLTLSCKFLALKIEDYFEG